MTFNDKLKIKMDNLTKDDLIVYAQAIESLGNKESKMAEALVRLDMGDGTILNPGSFFNKLTDEQRVLLDFTVLKKGVNLLKKIKSRGFKLAIDDFPTENSFKFIKNKKIQSYIDILKIDKSAFINPVNLEDENSFNVLTKVYDLARVIFKKTIVVEGVEDEEHVNRTKKIYNRDKKDLDLTELSSLYIQGYYYSYPSPIENLKEYYTEPNTKSLSQFSK